MTAPTYPALPPRVDDDLDFDAESGRLTLGELNTTLTQRAGNAEILDAYVDLVARRRGHRLGATVEVRTTDVDVLAGLLDLDALDIDRLIEQVLCAPHTEAATLVTRLRARRAALGMVAAAGVVVATSLTAGAVGHHSSPAHAGRAGSRSPAATAAAVPEGGAIGPYAGSVDDFQPSIIMPGPAVPATAVPPPISKPQPGWASFHQSRSTPSPHQSPRPRRRRPDSPAGLDAPG